jgi:rhodanese-related sulfurtransferase
MWRTVQRSLVIVLVSAVVGLAANAVRWDVDKHGKSRRISVITPPKEPILPQDTLPLEEARQLWQSGAAFFLDARAPADYAAGHIAGAFNLPAEAFEDNYPKVAPLLSPDSSIVVYCDGVQCDLSHELTTRLRQLGFKNVHILMNGWTVWHKAGLSTARGRAQ